jgi:protein TonB
MDTESGAAMSDPDTSQTSDSPMPNPSGAIVSSGWLAAETTFGGTTDKRKIGGAMAASVVSHVGILFLVLAVLTIKPAVDLLKDDSEKPKFVFLEETGPGGGGGGSPAPAPPKPMEVARHKAPDPIPVTPTPVVPPPPPPTPTLLAPVETNAMNIMQASGSSSVSLASWGGGGRGGGIGSGTGNGVGEGSGGGTGGGIYDVGNGVSEPQPIRTVDPDFTSEAMRNKVQGEVYIEAIVLANGTVGDTRIVRSLDTKYGLDQMALKAAKAWLFRPGRKDGVAVPVRVTLILSFKLH